MWIVSIIDSGHLGALFHGAASQVSSLGGRRKRSICLQTRGSGVSLAQIARRYTMNANLIFKWLRDPGFNPPLIEDCTASFLPVEVVAGRRL